jgi:hypothetical protein
MAARVVQVLCHFQQSLLSHLRKLEVVVHVVSPPFMCSAGLKAGP